MLLLYSSSFFFLSRKLGKLVCLSVSLSVWRMIVVVEFAAAAAAVSAFFACFSSPSLLKVRTPLSLCYLSWFLLLLPCLLVVLQDLRRHPASIFPSFTIGHRFFHS